MYPFGGWLFSSDVTESYLLSYKLFFSESRQSYLKIFRVNHLLVESSQSRVTRNVGSLRVTGLQV